MKKNNLTLLLLLLNAVLLIGIIFLLAFNYFKDSGETKEKSSSQSVVAKRRLHQSSCKRNWMRKMYRFRAGNI